MMAGGWPGLPQAYRNVVSLGCGRHYGGQVARNRLLLAPRTHARPSHYKTIHGTRSKKTSGAISWNLLGILVGQGRQSQILERLKEVTLYLLRTIVRQCEVHTAQKFRRGLQLYSVYSRMWGEEVARTMFANFRRVLISRGRHMLLSAVCFTNFNWDKEKIPREKLERAKNDLNSVGDLCRATVDCENCGKRQVIDQQMANVDYCICSGRVGYTNTSRKYESWEPFIEREHHIVWRQRHHIHKHLYAYKVYGTYDDVSLSAFMEVQLNTSFRSEWDDTALQLRVLDSDGDSNSDLIYWLVKFPHFFANRDYIFKRRFSVNRERNEVVVMSEAISPDYIPEEKGIHRVNEYWSTMVIRAHEDIHKPGIEYTLTYFDNPGTSLPQSVTNFIAATGFPNFLRKIHEAALSLQAVHEKGMDVYISLPKELRYPTRKIEELTLGRSVEPVSPVSKELEVADSATEDSQFRTNDNVLEGELLHIQKNTIVENDVKEDQVSHVMSLFEVGNANEFSFDSPSNKYSEKNLSEAQEVSCSEDSDIPVDKSSEVLPIMSIREGKENHGVEGDGPPIRNIASSKIENDSGDLTQDDLSSSDRLLHVQLGSRNVEVDLLEGMEVVAPDLEKKTLLLKKIEKIKANAQGAKHGSGIKKLICKVKSFQEHALQKREQSIRKMEELSRKSHYDHSGIDEKTLMQLKLLFQAMRDVLQADKDIRTGKSLRNVHENYHKKDHPDTNAENLTSETYSDSSASEQADKSRHAEDDRKDSVSPLSEQNLQLNTNKTNKTLNGNAKDSQPPDGPPPCDSGGLPFSVTMTASSEKTNITNSSEVEAYSNTQLDHSVSEKEKGVMNWYSSWLYVPSISGWWGSDNVQSSIKYENSIDPDRHSTKELCNDESSSESFIAQVWYVVGLGWIFHSETKLNVDQVNQESKLQVKADESPVSKNDCDKDTDRNSKWYWYPITGLSRVYTWAFGTSKENA